jgi:hypothetical protein
MSNKEKSSTARVANPGKWKLSFNQDRSVRINDIREFKEDCFNTHEAECGAEAGPFLKLGHVNSRTIPAAPQVPLKEDFDGEPDAARAFAQAQSEYQGAQAIWMSACKSAQHHKDDCETGVLPKTFVWLLSRLDVDLRARMDQDSQFVVLELAVVRDPIALLALIEAVLAKGDLDDEGYDNYVAFRDLFGDLVMKDTQSLADGVRLFKDKMAHIQSKPAYFHTEKDAAGADVIVQCFTEEFFVHLMFDNLSKKYDEAKVTYANQVSSDAIKRIITFDGLAKHFGTVRNVATGNTVSHTTLATDVKKSAKANKQGDKGKSKNKKKAGDSEKSQRVFVKGTHRECRHCNGAHFDDVCPQKEKKKVKSSSSTDPSEDEIAKVLAHLNAKKAARQAKEAKALAAQAKKYTQEEVDDLLVEYASDRP